MDFGPYVILHVLPDLQMGGGQQVVLRTVRYVDKTRFQHHVCYFHPPHHLVPEFRELGVEPQFIEHPGEHSRLETLHRVVELISRTGVDLVHVQGTPVDKLYGQLAALRCGLPVVRTLHGPRFRIRSLRSIVRHGIREMIDLVLEPATTRHYLAVSEAVRDSWWSYLNTRGVEPDQITVSYNGVPVDEIASAAVEKNCNALRGTLQLDGAYPVLINVGRLSWRKGQRVLIPVMQKLRPNLPSARLLLVGEGSDQELLAAAIARYGLEGHVQLLGHRDDVSALLAISDVFVFPSFGEGMPLSVLEAMAAGKPVVAFSLPGLSALVRDGQTGYLVHPHTPDALVEGIRRVCGDPERAAAMGRQGRELAVGQYNIRDSVRRIEAVYAKVLNGNGRYRRSA